MNHFNILMNGIHSSTFIHILFAIGAVAILIGIFLLIIKSSHETTDNDTTTIETVSGTVDATATVAMSSFKNAIAAGVIIAFVILFVWLVISVFKFGITGHSDFFSAFIQQTSSSK